MIFCPLIVCAPGPVAVTPPEFSGAREPQIAIGSDHTVCIAYGLGSDLYISVSKDEGKSYGAPILVGSAGKLSLGMRRGPRIVTHNGTITVTATFGATGGGRDGDLYAFRSIDLGRTWSKPTKVNDATGSAREGLHAMAVAPDGTIACTWLDLRDQGTRLYLSISKDAGLNWSKNVLVYASPSGTICQCCHPSLAFDLQNRLHIMFRNVMDGNRDMYLIETSDLRTFGPARKLGTGSWRLDACPMDGGMLALDPQGSLLTAWRRDASVFTAAPGGPEAFVSQGSNPWIASCSAGFAVVWCLDGAVFCKIGGQPTRKLSGTGTSPVIASSPDGKLAIAAWTQNGIRAETEFGGGKGTRTPDPLLAKQVLSQLSYTPGASHPFYR